MCIDFTALNKACPNDSYPLPLINPLVDVMAGHKLLTIMDAFSRYNQIRIVPENEKKASLITNHDLFCYMMISIDLKNAGATDQRLVNKIFKTKSAAT